VHELLAIDEFNDELFDEDHKTSSLHPDVK